jgi:AraC-like DNA-binding protein
MLGPLLYTIIPWHKLFFTEPFTYLAGPLMYFYLRSYKENITWQKALPHCIPFFLYFFISYWWLGHLAETYGTERLPEAAFTTPLAISLVLIRYTQLILYYFLSRRQLALYQRSIRQLFSETSRIDLQWGRWLINGYLLIVITTIVLYPFLLKYRQHFELLYLINIAVVTPYIYLITYKGITQPTIWQVQHKTAKAEIEEQLHDSEEIEKEYAEKQKRQKEVYDSRLGDIASRIGALMDREKLYQETELSLQDLASKLDCPPHRVSQAINEVMKKSFYDLVNGYRVEEAKRLLQNPKNRNYTILSVGFEAGFNSKTTFNTVFKKFTGYTPTQFRELQMQATTVTMV